MKSVSSGFDKAIGEFKEVFRKYRYKLLDAHKINFLKQILQLPPEKQIDFKKIIEQIVSDCSVIRLRESFIPFYHKEIENGNTFLISYALLFKEIIITLDSDELLHFGNLVADSVHNSNFELDLKVFDSLITCFFLRNIIPERSWFEKIGFKDNANVEYHLLKALSVEQDCGTNVPEALNLYRLAILGCTNHLITTSGDYPIFDEVYDKFYNLAKNGDSSSLEVVIRLFKDYSKGTCREILPLLLEFRGDYRQELIDILSVYLNSSDSRAEFNFILSIPIDILFSTGTPFFIYCTDVLSLLSETTLKKMYAYLADTNGWFAFDPKSRERVEILFFEWFCSITSTLGSCDLDLLNQLWSPVHDKYVKVVSKQVIHPDVLKFLIKVTDSSKSDLDGTRGISQMIFDVGDVVMNILNDITDIELKKNIVSISIIPFIQHLSEDNLELRQNWFFEGYAENNKILHIITQDKTYGNRFAEYLYNNYEGGLGTPDIIRRLKERSVQYLVHFTPLSNIPSILNIGIKPRSDIPYGAVVTDPKRLDKHTDCGCYSISLPQYRMMQNKIYNMDEPFAIIYIDISALYEFSSKNIFFLPTNASSKSIRGRFEEYTGLRALDNMFSGNRYILSRDESEYVELPDYVTTNPQAEVMIRGTIPPKYFKNIIVDSYESQEILKSSGVTQVSLCSSMKFPPWELNNWLKKPSDNSFDDEYGDC